MTTPIVQEENKPAKPGWAAGETPLFSFYHSNTGRLFAFIESNGHVIVREYAGSKIC